MNDSMKILKEKLEGTLREMRSSHTVLEQSRVVGVETWGNVEVVEGWIHALWYVLNEIRDLEGEEE